MKRITNDILPKKTYKRVLKMLEHYKQQDDEDIKENPNAIRCGYLSSIRNSIQQIIREDRVPTSKDHADCVIEYLIKKGILVNYCGDVSFPNRTLSTKAQIFAEANRLIDKAIME